MLNVLAEELRKKGHVMQFAAGDDERSKNLWNSKGVLEFKEIWATSLADGSMGQFH